MKKTENDMPGSDDPVKSDRVRNSFPIVGIGSSAGGLEAMEQFFQNMPSSTGMAFIVIQHLDPNYKGMLRELLQRTTKMPVHVAEENAPVRPDNVYIIPPNKNLSIMKDVLYLFEPVEQRGLRLPIDFFLRSLASDRREKSIGIILSGMGSDGSVGIRAIKEVGGLVLVQDPSFAKYESMPRSAIETVVADSISPASELPERLINILNHKPVLVQKTEARSDASVLEKIIILLRVQTGNDFSQYKKNTLYRRVERRMSIHKINKIADYERYLQENPGEVKILFTELLIGVTSFFRDQATWENLSKLTLPKLLSELPDEYIVRAWVPACSTGEEAYSLAIAFREAHELLPVRKKISFQIFATDLDATAIGKARKGLYPANISADVSAERLHRFFSKTDDKYRISSEIREMVIFAQQNILKDPPFTKLDMVSCRNLMIYLEPEVQKKILTVFHYSLNPQGILLLGTAETPGQSNRNYASIDTKFRIYQKSGDNKNSPMIGISESIPVIQKTHMNNNNYQQKPAADSIQNLTENIMMQYFSPPGVLAMPEGEILFISGNTGKYLTPVAGKAHMNLFLMAKETLRTKLPGAFRKALLNYDKFELKEVLIEDEGSDFLADITIQQLEKPAVLKGKLLVVFSESEKYLKTDDLNNKVKGRKSVKTENLEKELWKVKDELQTANEEMQSSQEELRSANEELQSTNEELQSTNEELMTSKEEMQSLNEELQTVNAELQSKIDDLAKMNNDINNLLNSIDIATLFLDKDLRIRQFTVPATRLFKLIQSDIGRVFTDQVSDLDYPDMLYDALQVLRTLVFIEKPVPTYDGRWFNIRIMPYRTLEDKIDGLVITYIDVTDKKRCDSLLASSLNHFSNLVHDLPYIYLRISADEKITDLNPAAEKVLDLNKNDVTNKSFYDLLIPKEDTEKIRSSISRADESIKTELQTKVKKSDGKLLNIKWFVRKFKEPDETESITLIGEIIAK